MDGWMVRLVLGPKRPILRGELAVSFRECIVLQGLLYCSL